jgi:hypothetical protein
LKALLELAAGPAGQAPLPARIASREELRVLLTEVCEGTAGAGDVLLATASDAQTPLEALRGVKELAKTLQASAPTEAHRTATTSSITSLLRRHLHTMGRRFRPGGWRPGSPSMRIWRPAWETTRLLRYFGRLLTALWQKKKKPFRNLAATAYRYGEDTQRGEQVMRGARSMRAQRFISVLSLAVVLALVAATALAIPVDVVLVLDNSGSMRKNDPKSLMYEVVTAFASRLTPDSRLGIIVFDQAVDLVLALTGADTPDFAPQVAQSLKRVTYRGKLTDIPAGIERAMYALRQHGRATAQRIIIFVTDGIVDLGNPTRNSEQARWLRENLAQDARRHGIRIFWVAFTEAADFQLIQSVAQTTGGEYFRVFAAEDIPAVFEKISTQLAPIVASAAPSAPHGGREAVHSPTPPSDWQSWLLVVIAGVAFIAVVMLVILMRKAIRRPQSAPIGGNAPVPTLVPGAQLRAIGGHANAPTYRIEKAVTRIGRNPKLNDVVLPS